MPPPLRLILCGALGRMGRRVAELAGRDSRFKLVAGIVRRTPGGLSPSPYPLATPPRLEALLPAADILVDFSAPEGSVGFARLAAKRRKPIVIGTTGFSPSQLARIRACSRAVAVLLSPNFSRGTNLLFELARRAARALDYDAAILETHHSGKKDSPSGTALRLAEAVRSGRPGAEVPIASQRIGTVTGDHTLVLAGPFERLELTHRAQSRDAFAEGALEAAAWAARRKPGLYGMRDVI